MAIEIDEDLMVLEICGAVIATARRRAGDWWEVSHWPRFFDRNQAITALTVTELLETGHRSARSRDYLDAAAPSIVDAAFFIASG